MGYWKKSNDEIQQERKVVKETIKDVLEYPIAVMPDRKITKETCKKFGVRMTISEEDGKTPTAYYFPYYDSKGKLSGYKKRDLTLDKHEKFHFTTIGKVGVDCKLFGQTVAENIEQKRKNLVYVEGEIDQLSTYQAMKEQVKGTKWESMEPFVVSVSCGTANAVEATLHNEDFIRSFDSLSLMFDGDEATEAEKKKGILRGKEATEAVASALVGTGVTLCTIELPAKYKDASDMLQDGEGDALAKIVQFGKKAYTAEKIVRASDIDFDDLIAPQPEGIYVDCFPELNRKIHGFRTRELVVLTSPSNVGKSTVCAMFANAFIEAGERVGMIFLEETNKQTLQRAVASKLKVNYNKFKNAPLACASKEEIRKAYDEIAKDDKLIMLGHFGSLPISELMNKIRHMHLVEGCSHIVLDHLSVVISGSHIENERKELDIVMTELAAFCAANDVCIIAVSHINRTAAEQFKPPKGKEDEPFWVTISKEQMRGSAALEQLAFIVLGLEPQIMPDRSRGNVRLTVLKNRPWGILGVADEFSVDEDTWEVVLANQVHSL
jgi:archaellum biogenesis ATPase FlaH